MIKLYKPGKLNSELNSEIISSIISKKSDNGMIILGNHYPPNETIHIHRIYPPEKSKTTPRNIHEFVHISKLVDIIKKESCSNCKILLLRSSSKNTNSITLCITELNLVVYYNE